MGRRARIKRERRAATPREPVGHAELRRRLLDAGIHSPVIAAEPELPKISDALVRLVEPVVARHRRLTKGHMESIMSVATVAWNAAGLPPNSPVIAEAEKILLEGTTPDEAETIREGIAELTERRRMLFPNDPRYVSSVAVTQRPNGEFDISAAYFMPRLR